MTACRDQQEPPSEDAGIEDAENALVVLAISLEWREAKSLSGTAWFAEANKGEVMTYYVFQSCCIIGPNPEGQEDFIIGFMTTHDHKLKLLTIKGSHDVHRFLTLGKAKATCAYHLATGEWLV